MSFESWVEDLEAVVEAAEVREPVTLLGISQGAATCIAFAVRHPERVARLILYGGYARGICRRGNPEGERFYEAVIEVARHGWGTNDASFRQVFTRRFVPEGTPEQLSWFNELCRKTTASEVATRLLRLRAQVDVTALLPRVRAPTLVLHGRDDHITPIAEGRLLASSIPGAQFVELESQNHVLLENEPAWRRFREAVLEWIGLESPAGGAEAGEEEPVFAALSPRERDVLARVCQGLANAEIAEQLAISEKTVRNHLSSIFDKLGVWTRAQAMVLARDRGFRPSS